MSVRFPKEIVAVFGASEDLLFTQFDGETEQGRGERPEASDDREVSYATVLVHAVPVGHAQVLQGPRVQRQFAVDRRENTIDFNRVERAVLDRRAARSEIEIEGARI